MAMPRSTRSMPARSARKGSGSGEVPSSEMSRRTAAPAWPEEPGISNTQWPAGVPAGGATRQPSGRRKARPRSASQTSPGGQSPAAGTAAAAIGIGAVTIANSSRTKAAHARFRIIDEDSFDEREIQAPLKPPLSPALDKI